MIDKNERNKDMSEEEYQQALDELYKDIPKWEPSEADLYAMFIEFDDPKLQKNFKKGDNIRYARDLAEAIVYLNEYGGFENIVDEGVDKFNQYVKKYLPQNQYGSHLESMKENLDSLNRWYEGLSFEQDARKPYDSSSKEQQVGEQLSFGIDLSKKIEKKDISKELNVEKTVETPKLEKDLETKLQKIESEPVIPMSKRFSREEVSESISNTNRRLPKEDWIRQQRQEERLRDLERRGMYNSFENGVSGDPDYDFDEFD